MHVVGLRGDDDAGYNDYNHGDDTEDSVGDQNVNNNIVSLELGEKSNLPYFSIPRGVAVLDCDSKSSWLD